jgi:uncharacterized protein YecE (DUF72 family)
MLHIGALIDRAPGRKYVSALRFAELAPRLPLPRSGTLASMRKDLPDDFVLALRAPRSAVVSPRGPLRDAPELESGLAWLHAAADALRARAVVIHTPSELTPGARSKDLLRAYAERLPRVPDRNYVWVAQGAWEAEEAQALCRELGLVRGFDPLETQETTSAGEVVYATLRALGHRAGFSYSALSDAVGRVLAHAPSEAFISVDADRSFDIAKRLKGLAAEQLGEAAAFSDDDGDTDDPEDEADDLDAPDPDTDEDDET